MAVLYNWCTYLVNDKMFSDWLRDWGSNNKIGPIKIDCLMTMPFFFLAWAFFNNSRLKFMHLLMLYVFSLYLFSTISILLPIFIYITMVFVMLWWSKLGKNTAWLITMLPICFFIIRDLFSWSAVKEYRIARILGF